LVLALCNALCQVFRYDNGFFRHGCKTKKPPVKLGRLSVFLKSSDARFTF
jgi:hypothetical protein